MVEELSGVNAMKKFIVWGTGASDESGGDVIEAENAKDAVRQFAICNWSEAEWGDDMELAVRDERGRLHRFTVDVECEPTFYIYKSETN
jgi:hypothetical protein